MIEHQTLENWLKKRAYLTPNRVAIKFQNESITFHQLEEKAKLVAKQLAYCGIQKGNFVALLMKNHPDTVYMIHALQKIGCPTVLLNHRLTPGELSWQIKDANCKYVITDKQFIEWLESDDRLIIYTKDEVFDSPSKEIPLQDYFQLTDPCSIMYTSGTTGYPKGVVQTYGNHWWSAIGSVLNLGLHEKDAWIAAVPIFHISGYSILMRSVIYGIPVLLFERFDEKQINQELINGRATIISVVSTMLSRLLETLGTEKYHPNFRCMLLGGGPASLTLLEKCKNKGIPVFQTYGMTETSSQIVTLSPEDSLLKLGSAGKPLYPSSIKIVKDGKDVGPNVEGEIVVKGPNVTPGYLNRKEANEESFKDGWFYTGDIGYLDDEGYLYVLDRRSDLIISGGENIYPAEIENVILSHPSVKDAGVVGIEDSKWGQVPCACIVLKESLDLNELKVYCEKRLAKYKVPKKFKMVEELPRNASNKLLRRELKKWFQ